MSNTSFLFGLVFRHITVSWIWNLPWCSGWPPSHGCIGREMCSLHHTVALKCEEACSPQQGSVFVNFPFVFKRICILPWLLWLSGLSAGVWTKGSPVQFPVRASAWVVGQVLSRGRSRGNHTLMFLSLSFSLSLSKNKQTKSLRKKNMHSYFVHQIKFDFVLRL